MKNSILSTFPALGTLFVCHGAHGCALDTLLHFALPLAVILALVLRNVVPRPARAPLCALLVLMALVSLVLH